MIPKHEETVDKLCIVCKGLGKYEDKVCSHCNGNKYTKWPKRCGGDCAKCSFPPENPKFQIGDMISFGTSGKAIITGIHYKPCAGNMCEYDGGAIPEHLVTKIGSNPTLSSFFREMGVLIKTHKSNRNGGDSNGRDSKAKI